MQSFFWRLHFSCVQLSIEPHEFPNEDKHRHPLTLNHMKSLLHDLHCQHDKHKKNAIFILKIAFFLQAILTSSPCVATSKLGDESRSQTEVCFGSTHLLPIATFRLNAVFLWPWKLIILPRQCQDGGPDIGGRLPAIADPPNDFQHSWHSICGSRLCQSIVIMRSLDTLLFILDWL